MATETGEGYILVVRKLSKLDEIIVHYHETPDLEQALEATDYIFPEQKHQRFYLAHSQNAIHEYFALSDRFKAQNLNDEFSNPRYKLDEAVITDAIRELSPGVRFIHFAPACATAPEMP